MKLPFLGDNEMIKIAFRQAYDSKRLNGRQESMREWKLKLKIEEQRQIEGLPEMRQEAPTEVPTFSTSGGRNPG